MWIEASLILLNHISPQPNSINSCEFNYGFHIFFVILRLKSEITETSSFYQSVKALRAVLKNLYLTVVWDKEDVVAFCSLNIRNSTYEKILLYYIYNWCATHKINMCCDTIWTRAASKVHLNGCIKVKNDEMTVIRRH